MTRCSAATRIFLSWWLFLLLGLLTSSSALATPSFAVASPCQTKRRSERLYYPQSQLHNGPSLAFTETPRRSAAKAVGWRLTSSAVTFLSTVQFSKSHEFAFYLVSLSFVPKALLYFMGDRIWNRFVPGGRAKGSDSVYRSMCRAVAWRTASVLINLALATFVTKNINVASKIVSTDTLAKILLMFGYERLWAGVEWGKIAV